MIFFSRVNQNISSYGTVRIFTHFQSAEDCKFVAWSDQMSELILGRFNFWWNFRKIKHIDQKWKDYYLYSSLQQKEKDWKSSGAWKNNSTE